MLPDGRIFYANGIEADENVRYHYELELGNRTRADRTRVLDLRGSEPKWTIPPQEAGASWNPQVKPGQNWTNGDPFGVIGAPGRPGDGFVGSKWGKLGGPPQQPSSPPDDKPYSERSTFCADIAQLPDGRMLMAGGTDYYNEPSLADRDEGAPADVGVLELEGLRASWIFDPKTDQHHATGADEVRALVPQPGHHAGREDHRVQRCHQAAEVHPARPGPPHRDVRPGHRARGRRTTSATSPRRRCRCSPAST